MEEDKKVSWEDIAWSNMYSIEALMNIFEKKGVITKQEVIEELRKLKDEHQKNVNYPPPTNGWIIFIQDSDDGKKKDNDRTEYDLTCSKTI